MLEGKRSKWSIFAAVGAAVAASACCTIPLALVALGLSGAWIGAFTALQPFQPVFITLALGLLGYAGYREYRVSRRPDCACEVSMGKGLRRTLLAVGSILTLGLIASPWMLGATASTSAAAALSAPASVTEVTLEVEGMTCPSCNVTVRKALTALNGVQGARVTFEPPEAVVTYDPSTVSIEQMIEAATNAGYPARPVPGSGGVNRETP